MSEDNGTSVRVSRPDGLAIGLLRLSPIFLVIGLALLVWNGHFVLGAATAKGTVTDLIKTTARGGQVKFRAKISYDVAGKTYSGHATWAANPSTYEVGEHVQVLYDPDDPSSMMLDTFYEKWAMSLIFIGIGAAFALSGLLRARKTGNQASTAG